MWFDFDCCCGVNNLSFFILNDFAKSAEFHSKESSRDYDNHCLSTLNVRCACFYISNDDQTH